jgi:hypothetical protein
MKNIFPTLVLLSVLGVIVFIVNFSIKTSSKVLTRNELHEKSLSKELSLPSSDIGNVKSEAHFNKTKYKNKLKKIKTFKDFSTYLTDNTFVNKRESFAFLNKVFAASTKNFDISWGTPIRIYNGNVFFKRKLSESFILKRAYPVVFNLNTKRPAIVTGRLVFKPKKKEQLEEILETYSLKINYMAAHINTYMATPNIKLNVFDVYASLLESESIERVSLEMLEAFRRPL